MMRRPSVIYLICLDARRSRSGPRAGCSLDVGGAASDVVAGGDGRSGPQCGLALGLVVQPERDVGQVEPPGALDRRVVDRLDRLAVKLIGLAPARPQREGFGPRRRASAGRPCPEPSELDFRSRIRSSRASASPRPCSRSSRAARQDDRVVGEHGGPFGKRPLVPRDQLAHDVTHLLLAGQQVAGHARVFAEPRNGGSGRLARAVRPKASGRTSSSASSFLPAAISRRALQARLTTSRLRPRLRIETDGVAFGRLELRHGQPRRRIDRRSLKSPLQESRGLFGRMACLSPQAGSGKWPSEPGGWGRSSSILRRAVRPNPGSGLRWAVRSAGQQAVGHDRGGVGITGPQPGEDAGGQPVASTKTTAAGPASQTGGAQWAGRAGQGRHRRRIRSWSLSRFLAVRRGRPRWRSGAMGRQDVPGRWPFHFLGGELRQHLDSSAGPWSRRPAALAPGPARVGGLPVRRGAPQGLSCSASRFLALERSADREREAGVCRSGLESGFSDRDFRRFGLIGVARRARRSRRSVIRASLGSMTDSASGALTAENETISGAGAGGMGSLSTGFRPVRRELILEIDWLAAGSAVLGRRLACDQVSPGLLARKPGVSVFRRAGLARRLGLGAGPRRLDLGRAGRWDRGRRRLDRRWQRRLNQRDPRLLERHGLEFGLVRRPLDFGAAPVSRRGL